MLIASKLLDLSENHEKLNIVMRSPTSNEVSLAASRLSVDKRAFFGKANQSQSHRKSAKLISNAPMIVNKSYAVERSPSTVPMEALLTETSTDVVYRQHEGYRNSSYKSTEDGPILNGTINEVEDDDEDMLLVIRK